MTPSFTPCHARCPDGSNYSDLAAGVSEITMMALLL